MMRNLLKLNDKVVDLKKIMFSENHDEIVKQINVIFDAIINCNFDEKYKNDLTLIEIGLTDLITRNSSLALTELILFGIESVVENIICDYNKTSPKISWGF